MSLTRSNVEKLGEVELVQHKTIEIILNVQTVLLEIVTPKLTIALK